MDIRNNFISLEREVVQWHRMSRELVESLSPEVFKNHGVMALRDMVSGHSGDGLVVGLGDLKGLL